MSYDGRVCWGLVADRDSVPDLAALAGDVEAAFEELRAASQRAGEAPPKRTKRARKGPGAAIG
jgi:hypothetical protein